MSVRSCECLALSEAENVTPRGMPIFTGVAVLLKQVLMMLDTKGFVKSCSLYMLACANPARKKYIL